jgi:hypothetical protein
LLSEDVDALDMGADVAGSLRSAAGRCCAADGRVKTLVSELSDVVVNVASEREFPLLLPDAVSAL